MRRTSSLPITRIGWKYAKELIGKGFRIVEYNDGHAELLGPKRILFGGKIDIPMEGDAQHFLTKHSVELLKKKEIEEFEKAWHEDALLPKYFQDNPWKRMALWAWLERAKREEEYLNKTAKQYWEDVSKEAKDGR